MRVFVSSTLRDLAEHREMLRLALTTSRYDFEGMEQFAAQPDPPLDVALAALEKCDVYVGIIGTRYGSSPPRRVRSYTELEYNRASELGIYRIILVSNEGPTDADGPEKRERLSRFRAKIMAQHTVQKFDAPGDVAWRVLSALRVHELRLREEQERS